MKQDLTPLMREIGYSFQDVRLLEQALTHSSYANEGHGSRLSPHGIYMRTTALPRVN